jgi:hypothetical protein
MLNYSFLDRTTRHLNEVCYFAAMHRVEEADPGVYFGMVRDVESVGLAASLAGHRAVMEAVESE